MFFKAQLTKQICYLYKNKHNCPFASACLEHCPERACTLGLHSVFCHCHTLWCCISVSLLPSHNLLSSSTYFLRWWWLRLYVSELSVRNTKQKWDRFATPRRSPTLLSTEPLPWSALVFFFFSFMPQSVKINMLPLQSTQTETYSVFIMVSDFLKVALMPWAIRKTFYYGLWKLLIYFQ